MILYGLTPAKRLELHDAMVAGVDVNMLAFVFGLAGAAALVTFAFVHNPRASEIRAKHRF